MITGWQDGYALSSAWTPMDGTNGRYRLTLTNHTETSLEGFRIGFSGPLRLSEGAAVSNGRIVTHLSNYAEIAPPQGFVLQPGTTWDVDVDRLDFPLRHW